MKNIGRSPISNEAVQKMKMSLIFFIGMLFSGNSYSDAGGCPARYNAVVDANSGWITCIPKDQDNGNGEDSAYRPSVSDLFMAVVGHADTPQLWVSSGYLNIQDACKGAMDLPNSCTLLVRAHNSQYIGTVRNGRGVPYVSSDNSIENATAAAMRACKKESDSCQEGAMLYNTLAQTDRFPSIPIKEYLAVTVAWPAPGSKIKPSENQKTWLTSGRPVSENVEAALSRCRKESGTTCVVGRHSGGGMLGRLHANDGYDYWVDAWDRIWLERNVDKLCPDGKQCKLIEVFDSNQIADQVIQ